MKTFLAILKVVGFSVALLLIGQLQLEGKPLAVHLQKQLLAGWKWSVEEVKKQGWVGEPEKPAKTEKVSERPPMTPQRSQAIASFAERPSPVSEIEIPDNEKISASDKEALARLLQ